MMETYTVTLNRPAGVKVKEMEDYIEEAVALLKGSYAPEEPMMGLDTSSIIVKKFRDTSDND